MLPAYQPQQPVFTLLDWGTRQILAIKLNQIKSDQNCLGFTAANEVEYGEALVIGDDRFPVDQA